jgi:uncharacterized repeat protein (TIGR01451 family)
MRDNPVCTKVSFWLAPVLGLAALTGALLLLAALREPPAALAQGPDGEATYYVAPGANCGAVIGPCFATVQAAVDAADAPDDVIKVASGVYTDVQARLGLTQSVYISKSITIQGGFDTIQWDVPNPQANPTTLDAQGQGRVIYVTGQVNAAIEGLRITGGMASGAGPTLHSHGTGAGVYAISATITLNDNQVFGNMAWLGGGVYLTGTTANLSRNQVYSNAAGIGGGGLLLGNGDAFLGGNQVFSNTADEGGGLFLTGGAAALDGNLILSNSAITGGGLSLFESAPLLTNDVVADNQASTAGSGLYLAGSSPRLLHTTIARNGGGDGSGLHLASSGPQTSTAALTNTILVGHQVGITAATGSAARLEATLWGTGIWANVLDGGGPGAITTGTVNLHGNPGFLSPDAGNYHIGPDSAALEAGNDAGVTTDMDGQTRPAGSGFDLGADELLVTLQVFKAAQPDPYQAGAPLTYTLYVTNTGDVTVTASVTDILPSEVSPGGTLTWTPTITAPGGVWVEQVVVTVPLDHTGPLTNILRVSGPAGASAVYTQTSAGLLCTGLSGIGLSAPLTGTLGAVHAFTATAAPPTATLPISYTWEATDFLPLTHTGGLTDVITRTWSVTGTKTVTVTALNCASPVSATHTISIEVPAEAPTEVIFYFPLIFKDAGDGSPGIR